MSQEWIERWQQGRIGWHESGGNAYLRRHWPKLESGSTVLVPLCGKSVDLIWLLSQGLDVTGIELSEIAVKAFFDANNLEFTTDQVGKLDCYAAISMPIRIYCGDYFDYEAKPADALFDRGALSAMSENIRPRYIEHTISLLAPGSVRMIITLEYEQDEVAGPPFAVWPDELRGYWPDLQRVDSHDDLQNSPPKFRAAAIPEFREVVWVSG